MYEELKKELKQAGKQLLDFSGLPLEHRALDAIQSLESEIDSLKRDTMKDMTTGLTPEQAHLQSIRDLLCTRRLLNKVADKLEQGVVLHWNSQKDTDENNTEPLTLTLNQHRLQADMIWAHSLRSVSDWLVSIPTRTMSEAYDTPKTP